MAGATDVGPRITFHAVFCMKDIGDEKDGNEEATMAETLCDELNSLKAIYGEELEVDIKPQSSQPGIDVGKNTELNIFCFVDLNSFAKVTVQLPRSYPDSPATISMPDDFDEFRQKIQDKLSETFGMPHLHLILDGMKNIATEVYNKKADKESPKTSLTKDPQVCKFYVQGKCRFGDDCHNFHGGKHRSVAISSQQENTSVACITSDEPQSCEGSKNHSSANVTTAEEKNHAGKKKSMRTATDVISRIQWDSELRTECFTVGYLDRFVGIIEKPFASFSWEDIASVDYNTLAIPKHRIQYFKYNGIKVWDKASRMDKVFGSTGDGETIYDIASRITDELSEEENEKVSKEEEIINSDSDEEIDVEDDDSKGTKKRKDRPTHFICFKVFDEEIKQSIAQVQSQLRNHDARLEQGFIGQQELHVTLCMLRIKEEDEKERVIKVLKEIQRLLVCMLPLTKKLIFDRLHNFRSRVLHVKIRSEPILNKLVELLMLKLRDAGISLPGNYESYTAHATIAKMNRPMSREMNTSEIYHKYYESLDELSFGSQPISSLLLCSTGKTRGLDGFYQTFGVFLNSYEIFGNIFQTLLRKQTESLISAGTIKGAPEEATQRCLQFKHDGDVDDLVTLIENMSSREICSQRNRKVIIMRGLPGSGKSFLLKNSNEFKSKQMTICSADHFFNNKGTGYKFDQLQLVQAHKLCQEEFLRAVLEDTAMIVIDNTNSQLWEYEVYKRFSRLFGYEIFIIELICETIKDVHFIAQRCLHRVGIAATESMWKNWVVDPHSVRINIRNLPSDDNFSLIDIIATNKNKCTKFQGGHILYSALYLDSTSKDKLMRSFPPMHLKVSASHMTLLYNPLPEQIKNVRVGENHSLKIVGYVTNDLVQVVAVEERGDPCCAMEIPHVTISTSNKAAPKHAADALQDKKRWKLPKKEIILSGTIGVQVATSETQSEAVTDPDVFREICSLQDIDIGNQSLSSLYRHMFEEAELSNREDLDIVQYSKACKPTMLLVFDFDGTLFDSTRPEKGRKLYEMKTGHPWPYKGWLSVPQSLEYPLQCFPGPAFTTYKNIHGTTGSKSIVLTARIEKMRGAVTNVLNEYGIVMEQCLFKPDISNGRACKTVPRFKRNAIKWILREQPHIKHVKVWEDREENLHAIKILEADFKDVTFDLINVSEDDSDDQTTGILKPLDVQVMDILGAYGVLVTPDHKLAVSKVLHFIADAWASVLNVTKDEALKCLIPFGSCPLNRKGDLDLCLLAPKAFTLKECFEKLKTELEKRGVTHLYIALKIRCPRFKVKIEFSKGPPLDLDISVACCLERTSDIDIDRDLLQWYHDSTGKDKIALEGPVFLKSIVDKFVTEQQRDMLRSLVDFIVLFLQANHLKGNAYHCLRTFHILKAIQRVVEHHSTATLSLIDIIINTFKYLGALTTEDWHELCADFVPFEYFSLLKSAFEAGLDELLGTCNVRSLLDRKEFPPQDCLQVTVSMDTDDEILEWKCCSLLEARVGTCVRTILNRGIQVFPGPAVYKNTIRFAVPDISMSRSVVEDAFRDFRKGFEKAGDERKVNITIDIA